VEQEHRQRVVAGDQWTQDFYGLSENGEYNSPPQSQEEMCGEFQTVLSAYTDAENYKLAPDYNYYRLARFLFNAEAPSLTPDWKEFYDLTSNSQEEINRRVIESEEPVSPAQMLQIAIEANGNNVPLGVLAAHNYLKDIAYLGRQYGDPDEQNSSVPRQYGEPAAHLQPWRIESPANSNGRLDKLGPLYHIFAAAAVGTWGPDEYAADGAAAVEALMRSGLNKLPFLRSLDVPDREKGLADECGADLADFIETQRDGGAPPSPLVLKNAELAFAGCPDPKFPDSCQYNFDITLAYAKLSCSGGGCLMMQPTGKFRSLSALPR